MKTLLIIARECRLRLRRPSFWVLTLLVPAVVAALYALPVVAARQADEPATVLVVDQTGLFAADLHSTESLRFTPMPSLEFAWQQASAHDLVLMIPRRETTIPHDAYLYYRGTPPTVAVQSAVDAQLQTLLRNAILQDVYDLDPAVYHSVEATHLRLRTHDAATGHESHLQVKTVVAIALAILMALALLLFGTQVARAVQEERHSRVAEIVATSVRPVQLLAGKVAGVALTATLQLTLWFALTAAAIAGVQSANPDLFEQARAQQEHRSLATKGAEATVQYDTPVQLVDQTGSTTRQRRRHHAVDTHRGRTAAPGPLAGAPRAPHTRRHIGIVAHRHTLHGPCGSHVAPAFRPAAVADSRSGGTPRALRRSGSNSGGTHLPPPYSLT